MIFSDVIFQGEYFVAALFCGVAFGVCYHVLFILRRLFNFGRVFTVIADAAFFVSAFFTAFAVFYPLNCFDIKWYVILGFFGGFCIEKFSFDKAVDFAAERLYNGVNGLKKRAAAKRKGGKVYDGEAASFKG
jgi:hypothetical protein